MEKIPAANAINAFSKFKNLNGKIKMLLAVSGILVVVLLLVVLLTPFIRDNKRKSDLNAIINAVYAYSRDHNGRLPDTDGIDTQNSFPKVETCIGSSPTCFNLGGSGAFASPEKIVPDYLKSIPLDPKGGNAGNSGYTIYKNSEGRIVVAAKGERAAEISVVK